ncbi:MAG: AarF/ABC1/UbiB kinase family protein [Deltaproteobacteria bacterium]|nr:AarF/ABC1/UbiB kinase family protein [Deltaproteobacteria bacterium]MBW2414099.1 AarF/ABC1/UbiB kinase family protein [Deltaproteobacteria bacterium]
MSALRWISSPAVRFWRSARIGYTAACVWLRYKGPRWWDRALGRDPDARDLTRVHERNAEQIFETAVHLKGLLIKMCQVIGTRSDFFPPPYVKTLSKAQDQVPPRDFEQIRRVVEEDFGKPLDAVFSEFETTPVAAASLAQVHAAKLLDGQTVAVKVQYPDIDRIVRTDLTAMRRICRIYERFDPQPIELLPLLDEMQKHLELELDFRREVENADRIRGLFANDESVLIPAVHHELSTQRVIVMEFVSGIKVTDTDALQTAGIDARRVVNGLMSVYNRMILGFGFFQADPHPGNIFVQPGPRFVIMDFGLAKQLPKGFGMGLFELMFSMMTFNEAAMIRAFEELGFATKTGAEDTYVELARRMIGASDDGTFSGEFTEEMTDELFEAIRENPIVKVPTDFVLVARAFSLLSGIAHTLGHRANVLDSMGPGGANSRTESAFSS